MHCGRKSTRVLGSSVYFSASLHSTSFRVRVELTKDFSTVNMGGISWHLFSGDLDDKIGRKYIRFSSHCQVKMSKIEEERENDVEDSLKTQSGDYHHTFKYIDLAFALFWTSRTNSDLYILFNLIIWAICPQ